MNEQLLHIIQEELHQYEADDIKLDIIINILDRLIREGYSDEL